MSISVSLSKYSEWHRGENFIELPGHVAAAGVSKRIRTLRVSSGD